MDKLFLPQGSLPIDELETPVHVPELFLNPVIDLIPSPVVSLRLMMVPPPPDSKPSVFACSNYCNVTCSEVSIFRAVNAVTMTQPCLVVQ